MKSFKFAQKAEIFYQRADYASYWLPQLQKKAKSFSLRFC